MSRSKTTRTVSPSRARRNRSIKERMADAIAEIGGAGEPVTEEALMQRHFSKSVIARLGNDARQIARRRWNKQVA